MRFVAIKTLGNPARTFHVNPDQVQHIEQKGAGTCIVSFAWDGNITKDGRAIPNTLNVSATADELIKLFSGA